MKKHVLGTPPASPNEVPNFSKLEREQRRAFAELLLEEMGLHDLLRAKERWELVCEQRGWTNEPEAAPAARKAKKLIEAVLARATAAADAMPDEFSADQKDDEDQDFR